MKLICLCLLFITGFSCKPTIEKKTGKFSIKIQPFTGANTGEIKLAADSIRNYYRDVFINEPIPLPRSAFYTPRGRYKADSLLSYLDAAAGPGEKIIGFTNKDISTSLGNYADWGVMGLGSCPGKSCVVSTHRLNKKQISKQLYKVAVHEIGHTLGLPHCPVATCFMRDAKGGNPTDEEKGFCIGCTKKLSATGYYRKST